MIDMKSPNLSNVLNMTLGIGIVLIWSTCYVTIKYISPGAEPLTFAASRALFAGTILLLLSIKKGCVKPPSNSWPWLMLTALTGMFGSMATEGSAIASILGNGQVILVVPLAVILIKEKSSLCRWVCLRIGF